MVITEALMLVQAGKRVWLHSDDNVEELTIEPAHGDDIAVLGELGRTLNVDDLLSTGYSVNQ